ncbi:MAG: glycosyltransferase, partial [Candidatus Micrarchaeota archaeon]
NCAKKWDLSQCSKKLVWFGKGELMRIGFFTDTFLPQKDGVVCSIESFGSRLAKKGHEMHVFAPKTSVKKHMGMQIHSAPAITFWAYPDYQIGIPLGTPVPELDIVHTHGPFSMGWFGLRQASKQHIPKVTTFHTLISGYVDYLSKHGQSVTRKMAEKYMYFHYNYYDKIICPSKAIQKTLPDDLREKSVVIPTGIDTDYLKPTNQQSARKKLKLDSYGRVYLSLGRLCHGKNIEMMIRASKDFLKKGDILVIAGKGPLAEELKALADRTKTKGKITFVGFVPDSDKPLYYSAADAFIIASLTETQGIVVTEALACGCPVMGADALAIPEMIDVGRDGVIFKPDEKSLAKAVKSFKPSRKMRAHARSHALKFSEKKMTDKLEKLYKSLI